MVTATTRSQAPAHHFTAVRGCQGHGATAETGGKHNFNYYLPPILRHQSVTVMEAAFPFSLMPWQSQARASACDTLNPCT